MEYVVKRNIKRFCNFYVSDLHLSVMLLPYISKQINEDVEITTIFEEDEKQNIEEILEKLNVKNKEKILNMNWFNGSKDSYEKIENIIDKNIENSEKVTIIVGGKNDYITNINEKIVNKLEEHKGKCVELKIINCYNINEIGDNVKKVLDNYDGILNTSGEVIIE